MATVMVQMVLEQSWGAAAGRDCRRAPRAWLLAVALGCAAMPAQAEKWQIKPSIAVNETLTDNVFLSSTNKQGDLVTGISPGVHISGVGSRASLNLNYTFTEQLYVRETNQRNQQNALTALGSLEAIEDFMFIDATGTISQQYLSAFGAVSPSTANVSRNRTETSNYALSPYLKGKLLNWADYSLRYKATTTSSQSSLVSDLQSYQWLGALSGGTRWSHLTWKLDASSLKNDYSYGRNTDATSYSGRLSYRFNPQVQVSLIGGRESNDYVSLDQQTNFTRGVGVDWTPDKRTSLTANVRNRFFGTGYDVNFSHRRRLALVTFRANRDVSSQPPGVSNTGAGSNYDALYSLIAANNPGLSPEALRAEANAALESRGLPTDGTVVNGYLTNREQLLESQNLSVAMLGVRNAVTLTATRSEQQPLGVANGLTNNYALADRILQRGVGLSWGHQLTGLSSLSLTLSQQRSTGYGALSLETETQSAYVLFTTRFSPKTSANIGARRVISSGTASYTESALTGGIFHSF